MARTATSSSNKASLQDGVSLVELLAALAILAAAVSLSAAGMGGGAERRALETAAYQLKDDLHRARLAARSSGDPVEVRYDREGYAIAVLDIDRHYPSGLEAGWEVEGRTGQGLARLAPTRLGQQEIAVTLRHGAKARRVELAAMTGEIGVRALP